jgi:hypothetical protein
MDSNTNLPARQGFKGPDDYGQGQSSHSYNSGNGFGQDNHDFGKATAGGISTPESTDLSRSTNNAFLEGHSGYSHGVGGLNNASSQFADPYHGYAGGQGNLNLTAGFIPSPFYHPNSRHPSLTPVNNGFVQPANAYTNNIGNPIPSSFAHQNATAEYPIQRSLFFGNNSYTQDNTTFTTGGFVGGMSQGNYQQHPLISGKCVQGLVDRDLQHQYPHSGLGPYPYHENGSLQNLNGMTLEGTPDNHTQGDQVIGSYSDDDGDDASDDNGAEDGDYIDEANDLDNSFDRVDIKQEGIAHEDSDSGHDSNGEEQGISSLMKEIKTIGDGGNCEEDYHLVMKSIREQELKSASENPKYSLAHSSFPADPIEQKDLVKMLYKAMKNTRAVNDKKVKKGQDAQAVKRFTAGYYSKESLYLVCWSIFVGIPRSFIAYFSSH